MTNGSAFFADGGIGRSTFLFASAASSSIFLSSSLALSLAAFEAAASSASF